MKKPPEIQFQDHIEAELLKRFKDDVFSYTVLEQSDISDTENFIAEGALWSFIEASQAEAVARLKLNYGTDAQDEFFKALRAELFSKPLWLVMRNGLTVHGVAFKLYYPRPRSEQSATWGGYRQNRFAFRHHFYFGAKNEEIDFVFFLNGLPIVTLELKHEANQTVDDAVRQYVRRDHSVKIFQHPFLHIAADTSDVKVATNPQREENFLWHNKGLVNEPCTPGEYPVEHLYAETLAPEKLLEDIAFFLVRVPFLEATDKKPSRPAFTIYPRYHQKRCVRSLALDISNHFAQTQELGKKYLVNHSAGSGKTLTMCWLADRLDSLYKPGTNEKVVETIFIVTDAKALDENVRDDLSKFEHLKDKVGFAQKSVDVESFLGLGESPNERAIIVTTQHKLAEILDHLTAEKSLQKRRVAFLVDEAHRGQDGKRAAAERIPFQDVETLPDEEEEVANIIRVKATNQLFVAFTATPSQATVDLFGEAFDVYTEAEAIQEGYIVDVASSIISYQTLYNLHCSYVPKPGEESEFPKGVVAKALKNIAYGDEGVVQYKAEVMLRCFENDVQHLIDGKAKVMIVTPSRPTGLLYYKILKEKLAQKGLPYKILYAFTDFVHPLTNETITEHGINELANGEKIEDRFDTPEYRLMVVANKFQTGFDQPLLAGMFLDRPVVDRNAVQTVSRLNRCCEGKDSVVVVDFTNNADAILRAFAKYRKGTPFTPDPPDPERCRKLYEEILAEGIFTQEDADEFATSIMNATDAQVQYKIHALRVRFTKKVSDFEARKTYCQLLAKYVKQYEFFRRENFFTPPMKNFYTFADVAGSQLIKQGSDSELMRILRHVNVVKASVEFKGVRSGNGVMLKPKKGHGGCGAPMPKATVEEMIVDLQKRFNISDADALFIREVTELKIQDPDVRETVMKHHPQDEVYLTTTYRKILRNDIQTVYQKNNRYEELADSKYTDNGGIFDSMATIVIQTVEVA